MEKVTVVNASGQTVSLWANVDVLAALRKQADAGEIQIEVGEPKPPRKNAKRS